MPQTPCKRPGPATLRNTNYTSQNRQMQILFRPAGISTPARHTLFQPRSGRKMVAQRRDPWVRETAAIPFCAALAGRKKFLLREAYTLPPLTVNGSSKFQVSSSKFKVQSLPASPLAGSKCRTNSELHR